MQADQSNNSVVNATILNVDDSDGARYAKSRILKRAGYEVIEAINGGEALALARSNLPALILLDTKLPDINGFEVCRRLKNDPATKSIMILQTSASFLKSSDKIEAIEGGADNYLFEPTEPDELIANVKALLRLGKVEKDLRDVDRRKDEFLATLAHELRNPLAPIRNAITLLTQLDPTVPTLQEKARKIILRQTEHMVRLVDDLLDVSRISQGKITLALEPVELKTFIHSAVETSAVHIEARKHQLTVSLPSQEIWINGDPVRLSQIVSNLLNNAAKFTPPGGQISLTASSDSGSLVIQVADNGIGIAPNNLDFIFGLFAQDGYSRDRVQDGLGIGLSLVRNLVELHGGTVKASSSGIGNGSQFDVSLPLYAIEHAIAEPNIKDSVDPEKLRILVVDDNADSAEVLVELLRLSGHEVYAVYTGMAGLDYAQKFHPQVVFLDIGLPDLDGYEVAVKLRQLPGLENVNLIALTGYGQNEDKRLAAEAGFNQHFVKPMDFSKIASLKLN